MSSYTNTASSGLNSSLNQQQQGLGGQNLSQSGLNQQNLQNQQFQSQGQGLGQNWQNQQFGQFSAQNLGRIQVTVAEARNLLRKDVASRSDPYVILSIHKKHDFSLWGQEQRTTTFQNNQNPTWGQTFSLTTQDPQNDILRARVFDHDKLRDDLIGEVDIPLFRLLQNQQFGGQQGLQQGLQGQQQFGGQQGQQQLGGQQGLQNQQQQQFGGQQGFQQGLQGQQFGNQQGLQNQQLPGQQGLQQGLQGQQGLQNQQFAGQQGLANQGGNLGQNQQLQGQNQQWNQQNQLAGQSGLGLNNQNQQFQGQAGQNQQWQGQPGQQGQLGQNQQWGSQSGLGLNQNNQQFQGQNQFQNQQGILDQWFPLTPARAGELHLIINYQGLLHNFQQQQGLGINQQSGLLNAGINQGLAQGAVVETIVTQPIQETIQKPAIVQEVVRTDHIVEVQPVITRHVEQPHVHHVEKHVFQPAPLPAQTEIVNAPIIHEQIHPHVINEVQPVLHREVAAVEVQHTQALREEHIVLPPQHSYEVVQDAVLVPGQSNIQQGVSNISLSSGGLNQAGIAGQGLASQQQFGQPGIKGAEIPRQSKTAQAYEDLAAREDRRNVQAGAPIIDSRTGEVVQPRSSNTAAKLEEKAALAEAKYDRKHGSGAQAQGQTQAGSNQARFIA